MTYLIFALITVFVVAYFWINRVYLPAFTKKKAHASLLELLFPEGIEQQEEVMKVFKKLTNQRFTNEQILDYFVKIKGLQTLDLSSKTNFWIKKYLLSPTDIRLNYFEQVKFYETFMNYPRSFGLPIKKKTKPEKSETIFAKEASDLFLKREYA